MARGRKKKIEDHENHDRWLVSYADFITLLFAFFVVMYAISSVNEGKYRVLSDTMVEAFSEELKEQKQTRAPLLSPERQQGDFLDRGEEKTVQHDPGVAQQNSRSSLPSDVQPQDDRLWAVASNLDSALQDFVDRKLVKINLQGDKIEVQLSNKMLFGSGSARLSAEARKAFRDIATIIKPLDNSIHVEGHTDNVPIKTITYPSNWELSAARAASVVEYLARQGVDPARLAAIGYGEYRPVSSNETAEGRSQNRRVSLLIRSEQGANIYGGLNLSSPDEGDVPWAESPGGL